ncbi:hypothetical protein FKO01_16660 [Mesorhizobium sp. B2-3-3]|nr:hypothetical protein FKO01_16660 [Mesorhizobium sp. B2-3-3]
MNHNRAGLTRRPGPLFWRSRAAAVRLRRACLRPDTYVALADPQASVDTLERYCRDRGFLVGI